MMENGKSVAVTAKARTETAGLICLTPESRPLQALGHEVIPQGIV